MLTAPRLFFRTAFLAAALSTLTIPSAQATTMIALPLPQLTAKAGAIVHGTVTGVRSDWNADRTHIFTFITVRVDRYLKGDLGRTITVMEFGGTVGGMRQVIAGTPQFTRGEEVVLFLSVHPPMYPAVLALSQGKFSVVADRASGRRLIARHLYGASVRGRTALPAVPSTLAAFESQVRALVDARTGQAVRRKGGTP